MEKTKPRATIFFNEKWKVAVLQYGNVENFLPTQILREINL